ncbi:hypothetical protein HNQ85_000672 [Anoxybacillus calidus]|jgi:hypothetical protein|uniref:Uncharacterized protein n=1 Tax=[Anoxybacillus] calidus TaxID=575178 RepID=A0A7W0BVX1_9BACL|nr:hypothetical protein [Anoxybacillus calidus]MBA2870414.1 hypothetical protein [Anoxybacillus calidus]
MKQKPHSMKLSYESDGIMGEKRTAKAVSKQQDKEKEFFNTTQSSE